MAGAYDAYDTYDDYADFGLQSWGKCGGGGGGARVQKQHEKRGVGQVSGSVEPRMIVS